MLSKCSNIEISNIWEHFIEGREADLSLLRPEVADSWQRCRALNISPTLKNAPAAKVSVAELLTNNDLLQASEQVVRLLCDALFPVQALISVCDSSGRPLLVAGAARALDEAERIRALPGFDWGEPATGNNLLGTTLVLKRPHHIDWTEHYVADWQAWAGCAAPIVLPAQGSLIGAIMIGVLGHGKHPRTLEAACDSARLIGDTLHRIQSEQRLRLDEAFQKWTQRYRDAAIVQVDSHGLVTRFTPTFFPLLNIRNVTVGQAFASLKPLDRFAPACLRNEPVEVRIDLPDVGRAIGEPVHHGSQLLGHIVVLLPTKTTKNSKVSWSWSSDYTFGDIVGESAALRAAVRLAMQAAETDYPVLLIGESGSGKELFAHSIHDRSGRREAPFVTINSGTLSNELVVSEFCGYEAGSFTGAARTAHRGILDAANGGTLFIDELQDMGPKGQSLLLRFLETGQFLRVGGVMPAHSNVRLIAAINVPLDELSGRLRPDLLYRINCLTIEIPALRGRPEDIRPIGERCLRHQLGFNNLLVDDAVWETLSTYALPGNARELKNILLRAALTCRDNHLTAADLPKLSSGRACAKGNLHDMRQEAITAALLKARGIVADAARELNVHRSTIYRRLKC